jgi:hypothetical protein
MTCDAADCAEPAQQHYTVGERPPGMTGLEGWPDGAPALADPVIPSGRLLQFCTPHARRIRDAVQQEARPLYGIRPHRLMSDEEHERARLAAETLTLDPEAAHQLREEIRRTMATLAHVAAPVDLTLPKRGGLGRTACGEDLTSDTLMAMSADAISCPTCAAAYVADPSLLGPVEICGTLNGTPTGQEIQR